MRIVLRGEGAEEHRLAGHQRVGVLVERQAPKRGGLHAEAREDGTAGTIGSEQSRAGLKWECCAAGVCDSGHQVATAGIDGSHDCVVYWFDPKRRTFSATLCRQPMRSLSCSAQPAHVIISGLARLNAAQRRHKYSEAIYRSTIIKRPKEECCRFPPKFRQNLTTRSHETDLPIYR